MKGVNGATIPSTDCIGFEFSDRVASQELWTFWARCANRSIGWVIAIDSIGSRYFDDWPF
jgi:hypothetical protein